jgi:methylated-DNA-[protein]-cysteine S-methyltransferase
MTEYGFTLFETPIGRCGVAWSERGIVCVQLPEAGDAATRARLRRRVPKAREAAPPRRVQRAVDDIKALLRGRSRDLSRIELDMDGVSPFYQRVYRAARSIAPGATLSYGELAKRLGAPKSARAVGQALGSNPFAIVVPCHRVLAAGGKTGGFSAEGGVTTKLRMLAIERGESNGAPLGKARRTADPAGRRAAVARADGLGFDPRAAVAHLRAVDPALARVIAAVGPLRMEIRGTTSIFAALAEAIVYQQLTGKAAATIYSRVCALCPRSRPTAEQILLLSDAKLRGAGLSRAKALALRDLARAMEALSHGCELVSLAHSRRRERLSFSRSRTRFDAARAERWADSSNSVSDALIATVTQPRAPRSRCIHDRAAVR